MSISTAVNTILLNADYFLLLLLRVGALVFSSPVFGRNGIPAMAKIGLITSLTVLFFFALPPGGGIEYGNLFGFFLVCAGELLMGLALSFVTNLFFTLVFVSGQLIDMQIGFGIVNVMDPLLNVQIPMTGNLLNIMLLVVFFMVGGDKRLVEIVFLTLEEFPVGRLSLTPYTGLAAAEIFARSFTLGVMVALPVIGSGLIIEIGFGVLMRTVPQLNVFVVGIPIKILIGFVMLIAITPVFVTASERIFSEMFMGLDKLFGTLMP